MTLSQIARHLGVSPAALSNWRNRYPNFPKPESTEGNKRLFSLRKVQELVKERGLGSDERQKDLSKTTASSSKSEAFSELDSFINWTVGDLRNGGLDVLVAFRLTAALLVEYLMKEKKVKVDANVRLLIDQIMLEVRGRDDNSGEPEEELVSKIDHNLIRDVLDVWKRELPNATSQEWVTAIAQVLQRHAKAIGSFEHGTPESFAELVSRLAPGHRILNIGSGLGFFARAYGSSGSHVTGQEINQCAVDFHLLMSCLASFDVDLRCENALNSFHQEWQANPFDAVVSDAPWNVAVDPETQVDSSDPRWVLLSDFKSKNLTDYFIESALAYLRPSTGTQVHRAIIGVPPSWLYSEQANRVRNFLVRGGFLEAVIQMGQGIYATTSIPPALIVLSRPQSQREAVRMIDARESGEIVGRGLRQRQRFLSKRDIDQIVHALNSAHTSSGNNIHVIDVPVAQLRSDRVILDPIRYTRIQETRVSVEVATQSFNAARDLLIASLSQSLEGLKRLQSEGLAKGFRPGTSESVRRVKLDSVRPLEGLHLLIKNRAQGEDWATEDLQPNDTVISMGGSSLGIAMSGEKAIEKKVAWLRVAILRSDVSTAQVLAPRYLLVWAIFGGLRQYLESQRRGFSMPFVGRRVLEDVSLPIPPLQLQERIVAWAAPLLELVEHFGGDMRNFDLAPPRRESFSPPGEIVTTVRALVEAAEVIVQDVLGPIEGVGQ
jgi:DNA-binding transcriptional MerR regulator